MNQITRYMKVYSDEIALLPLIELSKTKYNQYIAYLREMSNTYHDEENESLINEITLTKSYDEYYVSIIRFTINTTDIEFYEVTKRKGGDED